MKKLLLILIYLFCTAYTIKAQELTDKPRYLKHALPLCPIDIMKTYSKEGLLKGNSNTISIDSSITYKEVKAIIKKDNSLDEVMDSIKIREVKRDTFLTRSILIESGLAFNIVSQIGSFSIIKFWPSKTSKGQGLFASLGKTDANGKALPETFEIPQGLEIDGLELMGKNKKNTADSLYYDLSKNYYIVPTRTILANSTEFENKKGSWNIGLLALPVKIRPFATESGQFDFSDGYSVGTTFAFNVHNNWKTGFNHSLLFYAGISSYTADSTKLKEQRNDYKIATFSPAVGWMWGKSNVQLSLLMGIDFPSGNLQKKWVYRNQPWFGLGLGISLFKINNEDSVKIGENK